MVYLPLPYIFHLMNFYNDSVFLHIVGCEWLTFALIQKLGHYETKLFLHATGVVDLCGTCADRFFLLC